MNEDVAAVVVEEWSNSSTKSSLKHKHRHHHHNHLTDRLNSFRGKHVSVNYTEAKSSNRLYDQPKKHYTALHVDDELYSGISHMADKHQLAPETTISISYTPNATHNNRTLLFQPSFTNTSSLQSSFKQKPFYRQHDINNDNTLPEYHENNIGPFNPGDDASKSAQFDPEFVPEKLFPSNSDHNRAFPSLREVPFDPYPLTPWSVFPGYSSSTYQTSPAISQLNPLSVNTLFNSSITNVIINRNEIHRDLDYIIPNRNFSTFHDNNFNISSPGGAEVSADDLYTWSILMMAPLVIFGVTGNALVILAISLEKRLQNVTNYFLLSLSVTDLLVSLIVMPFSIINVLTGRWLFGLLLCDFFVTSDVLMCTSSILHLCTISLERYIGIRYPLWTKNKSKRIVLLKIVFVWTISLAITSPITVLGVIKSDNVLVQGECVLNNAHFIIYGSTFAFFIPLTIMVVMYVLTVRMLNKQARLCQSRRADDGENEPIIRRSTSRRNWQGRRNYYGGDNLNATSSYTETRFVDDYTTGSTMTFHTRSYRSPGVNRHNTIPLSHYRYNDYPKRESGGSSSGSARGSNNSINKGRSGSTTVGSNNNNNNNCNADSSSGTFNSRNLGRRARCRSQNVASTSPYLGINPSPDFPYCNGLQEDVSIDLTSDSQNCCSSHLSSSSSSSSPTSSTNREPKRLHEMVRKHHMAVKAANILLMKRDNNGETQVQSVTQSPSTHASVRRDNSVRTEQKASKVLGVVFMIFLVCWAPFFTVNILTAVCTSCSFEPTLVTAFVWLGYVSSTLNPIIYTIFNNIFRITFIKLLCCRYRLLHRAKRIPGSRNGGLNCSDFSPALHSNTTIVVTTSTTIVEESNC